MTSANPEPSGALVPPNDLKLKRWSNEMLRKRFAANCREMLALFSRQGILTTNEEGYRQP